MIQRVSLLLLLTLLVGCTEKVLQEQPTAVTEVCVSATANTTKTSISGNTISWSAGDNLGMFIDGLHYNIKLFNSVPSPSRFVGAFSTTCQTCESVNYYAYYPYADNFSGTTVSATLPISQVAPFDSTANYMVADVVSAKYDEEDMPDISLAFNNQLFSLVKITVTNSDESYKDELLESIELVSTEGKRMAGAFSFDIASPTDEPTWNEGAVNVSKVSSDFSEPVLLGLGDVHSVFLFVKPGTYNGFKVCVRTDSNYATVMTNEIVVLERNKVTTFPIIDYAKIEEKGTVKKIACWGDSYTHGSWHGYPQILKDFLGKEWNVYDGGHYGDRSVEIVARQGGLKLYVDSSFTLPSTDAVAISGIAVEQNELTTSDVDNPFRSDIFIRNGSRLFNTCLISGIECNLTRDGLKRVESGEEQSINKGTDIITYGARNCRDALNVIYMFANGGWNNDLDLLVKQHWAMIKYSTSKQYIVLAKHHGDNKDFITSYNKAFGSEAATYCPEAYDGKNHVIDLKKAVADRGEELLVKTGVYSSYDDITDSDRSRLKDGEWPYPFMRSESDVHPSTYGETAISILIHDKMVKLGYLEDSYLLNDVTDL